MLVDTATKNVIRASLRIVWLSCLSLWPLGAAADTYPRQPTVDVLHYLFKVTLSDDNDELIGETTIDLRFTRDGITEVALDLASATGGKGMTVTEVISGNARVPFAHKADRLKLTVAPSSRAGERREFTIRYGGVPAAGLRILKNKFGERVFFSENWPNTPGTGSP